MQISVTADLVGANACAWVYPNVRHLLCRWHVDRHIPLIDWCVHKYIHRYYT